MVVESKIVSSVGYALALASLCSLLMVPTGQALAAEGDGSSSAVSALAQERGEAVTAKAKNETVNVTTRPDGAVQSVEVTTVLDAGGSPDIADYSLLSDLKAKGDDTWFTDDGQLVWHTEEGKSVTYTGTSDAQLPIEVKVTYRYNGSYITPQELPGKSGHVVIRYDYYNNSKTTVDGVSVYTPFVAMTGMLLDTDVFKNITITNGKLIEDSDRIIAVGYAMPGLKTSLDSGEDLDVPEYFEVEADVENFEIKSTLTMVSPDMLSSFDTSKFDSGEYSDASDGLRSAMSELMNGSNELSSGLSELAKGAESLADGAKKLDGAMATATNEMPALKEGVKSLHDGSSQLVMLANGLGQGLADVKTQVALAQQGAAQLDGAISSTDMQSMAAMLGAVSQELQADAAKVEAVNVQANVVIDDAQGVLASITAYEAAIDADSTLTADQKAALKSSLSDVKQQASQVQVDAQALAASDKQLTAYAIGQAAGALQAADFSALSAAAKQLADGLQAIVDQGFGTEQQQESLIGAAALMRGGASALDAGLGTFEGQADQLVSGMSELASGVSQLSTGSTQLSEAVSTAAQGTDSLASGIAQFNDEGITKIADAIDNKLVKLSNRFKAVTDAGGQYTNFGGITQGTTGSVKFVFETAAIEEA